MKVNWKVILALVLMVGVAIWAFDSTRQRFYSGNEISAPLGSGPVYVNHTGDTSIEAQLVGMGVRGSFSAAVSGETNPVTSLRQGTGRNTTHVATVMLPPGTTEIRIIRGSNVSLAVQDATPVEVTINPLDPGSAQGTLFFAAVVLISLLFYISHATEHRLIRSLRGQRSTNVRSETATTSF